MSIYICNSINCSLNVYKNSEKCALHCTEHKSDFFKIRIDFYNALEAFIANNSDNGFCFFDRFVFPKPDIQSDFNYIKLLKAEQKLHFRLCHFFSSVIELDDCCCFFDECKFHENWSIYNSPILENVNDVLYQNCTFESLVTAYTPDNGQYLIESSIFNDCEFLRGIEFNNVEFSVPVFRNTNRDKLNMKSLTLLNCVIADKFILNNYHIESLFFEDSFFNAKFEFKTNSVAGLVIVNTNFLKLTDMNKTEFGKFSINKSIFNEFVGFEKCKFGNSEESDASFITTFKYVTFLNFINFRSTEFKNGLNIETINLKEAPNFLYAKINPKNSSRETFRIIKSSFDKIHNYVEANKYFAFEMSKYKEELKNSNNIQEKFVLFLNEKISNFGQSYVRPLCFIFCISVIHYLLVLGYESNLLYKIHPQVSVTMEMISSFFNSLAKNILPFSKVLKNGMESVSLVFYVIYTRAC